MSVASTLISYAFCCSSCPMDCATVWQNLFLHVTNHLLHLLLLKIDKFLPDIWPKFGYPIFSNEGINPFLNGYLRYELLTSCFLSAIKYSSSTSSKSLSQRDLGIKMGTC